MTREQLIRELEYFRDLGFGTIDLPDGLATIAAGAQPAAKRAQAPATARAPERIAEAQAQSRPPAISAASQQPEAAASAPATPGASDGGRQFLSLETKKMPSMFDALGVNPEEDSLARIREDIGDCKRCKLCQGRTNIVFGSGNENAKLVFVGEGPGEDEDLSGLPFVGRAGQLLTKMIEGTAEREGIPIKRPDVYICNVVKCRPPSNRKPENEEMEMCGQFLFRQLAVLKPKAICVLGATAAQALLDTKERMGKLRGNWFQWREFPVMVTYHPSYLLRAYNAEAKREAWEDLKQVLHRVYDHPANRAG